MQKKSLTTGDIVRLGVLVEARPFYIQEDGNEDVQVTTTRGSNAASARRAILAATAVRPQD